MTATATRKPSPAQARELINSIDRTDSERGKIRVGINERTRQVMIDAGWIVERRTTGAYTSRDFVTPAGYAAVGRATEPEQAAAAHAAEGYGPTETAVKAWNAHIAEACRPGVPMAQVRAAALNAAHAEAYDINARMEMDEATAWQAAAAYRHFAEAARVGRDYRDAIDILHAEALTENTERAGREVSLNGIKNARPDDVTSQLRRMVEPADRTAHIDRHGDTWVRDDTRPNGRGHWFPLFDLPSEGGLTRLHVGTGRPWDEASRFGPFLPADLHRAALALARVHRFLSR